MLLTHHDFIEATFAKHNVFWLGAGFSTAATAKRLPPMAGFFREMNVATYPKIARFIESEGQTIETANLESIQLSLDQLAEQPGLTDELIRKMLGGSLREDVARELERFVINRTEFSLDYFDTDSWAHRLMLAAEANTTVISTNYDTVADQLLSARPSAEHCGHNPTCHHCNMRAILLDDCGCSVENLPADPSNGALLKIHGSVSWRICENARCSAFNCIDSACNFKHAASHRCKCCRQPTRPLLILPSLTKRYDRFPELRRMWKRAQHALSTCETVTFAGFSFSSSDCFICNVVRHCLSGNQSLRQVNLISRDIDKLVDAVEAKRIVPDGVAVSRFKAIGEPGVLEPWAARLAQLEIDEIMRDAIPA